jgi:hypothetical protein
MTSLLKFAVTEIGVSNAWRSSRARRGFFTSIHLDGCGTALLQWQAVRGSRKARRSKLGTPTSHGLPPSLAWG